MAIEVIACRDSYNTSFQLTFYYQNPTLRPIYMVLKRVFTNII